ncbi:MAG: M10 family metallopeptidase, partial [Gammaproteobacteria bacterium]
AQGTGVILTYSFPEGDNTAYDPDSYPPDNPFFNEWIFGNGWTALDAAQQANFVDALDTWSNVADIDFVLAEDDASEVGEIRVAFNELVDFYGAGAWAYLPDDFPYAADIWINHLYIEEIFDEGTWYFNTLIHELGHALGLKHPFDTDGSGVVLAHEFDNLFYTVMTYTDHPDSEFDPNGPLYIAERYPTTPMVIDILSIQYLYGPNMTFNADDSVYTYQGDGEYFETIWDAGGEDTIVYNSATGGLIDLREGAFSELGQPIVFDDFYGGPSIEDPRTVWIAYDAEIENAEGGDGDDLIFGNDLDNELSGFDGDDSLYGFAGNDELSGGAESDSLYGGMGNDVLNGDEDNDSLAGGGGNDRADYQDATAGVTVNLADGNAQDTIGAGTDTLSGIENLSGSAFGDLLTGSVGANMLEGEAGNDVLNGGDDNDLLHGGTGNDTLAGGAGDDLLSGGSGNDGIDGGAGTDTVDYSDATTGVTVNLGKTSAQDTSGSGMDTLS